MYFNVYGGFGLHSRWVKKTWKLIPNYAISYKSKQLGVILVLAIVLERNPVCMSYTVTSPLAEEDLLADGACFDSNFAGDPARR